MDSVRAILIDRRDSVVTVTSEAPEGAEIRFELAGQAGSLVSRGVPKYHKAALRDIAAGETVYKYGEPIGRASEFIPAGAWVHCHNLKGGDT